MTILKTFMYLLPSKTNKKGCAPVYCRVKHSGKTINLSTDIFIEPIFWDKKKGKVKAKHTNYIHLNIRLKEVQEKIDSIYKTMVDDREVVSLHSLKQRFRNKTTAKDLLIDLYDHYIENIEDKISNPYAPGTIKHYKISRNKMVKFLCEIYRCNNISVARMNHEFIKRFEIFLDTHYENSINMIHEEIKRLKAVINEGLKLEWVKNDPLKNYTGRTERTNRKSLTFEQLRSIENLVIEGNDTLNSIKDMFLFMAYTGLSYSDLIKLKPTDIVVTDNKSKIILIERSKTKGYCRIPVFPKAESLINTFIKHPRSVVNGTVFPKYCNEVMNRYLKIIAKKANILETLSCHIGRHTFATLSLENSVPIETVSKVLGHSSIKTTQIYGEVTQLKIENDYRLMKTIFG